MKKTHFSGSKVKIAGIIKQLNFRCVERNLEKYDNMKIDEFETEKKIESHVTDQPFRIFQTSKDLQAYNRRIVKKYQRTCDEHLFKFCVKLYAKTRKVSVHFQFSVVIRIDKLPSEAAYKDLKSWWSMNVAKKRCYQTFAPNLPTLQEVKDVTKNLLHADEILEFKRQVTSVRAVSSSVQINETWFPRNG